MEEKQNDVRKQLAEEYLKCVKNPSYFIRNYVKIVHQKRGLIDFDLFKFQERALRDLFNYRFNVIFKSRQMGITTLLSAYALWLMLFNDHKGVLALSFKQDKAKNLVTKVKRMHRNLPSWLKEGVKVDNQLKFKFENGSEITAEATTEDSGRSESVSFVIIDEAASISNADEVWAAIKLTLDVGNGNCAVVSTPKGVGDFFHKTITGAKTGGNAKKKSRDPEIWEGTGRNDFHLLKLPWDLHPERGKKWREEQTRTMGKKKAARECDCVFTASGDTVIDQKLVSWYKDFAAKTPEEEHRRGRGEVWVWQPPKPESRYVLGSDVARGDASDFSTFQIFDADTMEQAAEYQGKMPPADFGDLLRAYGTAYNDALVVVERDSYGWAAMQQIVDKGYNNLLYTSNDLKFVDVDEDSNAKLKPGIGTNRNSRKLIISNFTRFINNRWARIRSERLMEELDTFVWKGRGMRQKPEHMNGYHDDLIFAAAFAMWARDKALKYQSARQQQQEQVIANLGRQAQPLSGSSGFNDAPEDDVSWLL